MRELTLTEQRDLEMRRARMARSSYRSNTGHPTLEQHNPQIMRHIHRHVSTARLLNQTAIRMRKEETA